MAQEIRVDIWCDGLKLGVDGDFVVRHDPRVEAVTRSFALDGKPAKLVDLCDPCNGELTLDELREVLKQFGVTSGAGKPGPGPAKVRAEGPARLILANQVSGLRNGRERAEGGKTFVCLWCPLDYSSSGWLSHVQKKHGFKGIKDAVGVTCPVCGQGPYETLSNHVSRAHDEFLSITEAFHWAKDNGDPFGVYRARHAAGQNVVEAML
jgi:hypothetical protein